MGGKHCKRRNIYCSFINSTEKWGLHNYFTFVSITWYARNNHFLESILVQKLLLFLDICSYFLGAKKVGEDGVREEAVCQLPTVRT